MRTSCRCQLAGKPARVSLLIRDMLIDDEKRCGRLRDHLALVAEGCDSAALILIRADEIVSGRRRLAQ